MASQALLGMMVRAIHAQPELKSCIIAYQGDGQSRVLSEGGSPRTSIKTCAVVIEEIVVTDPKINQDTALWMNRPGGSPAGVANPLVVTNSSKLWPELGGAAFSCGLAVVSAVGVAGGVAGEIPSVGSSTFLIAIAWTGLVTSGVQCANGVVRLGMIAADPGGTSLQALDDNTIYAAASLIIDGIGLLGGAAALPGSARNLWAIIVRHRAFVARRLTEQSLRQMNAAARAALMRELIADASRTEAGRQAILAALRDAKVGSTALARPASLSVRNAAAAGGVIRTETMKRLKSNLIQVLSLPFSIGLSGAPPSLVGGGSGSVNWLIHVIDGQSAPAH